LVETFLRAKVTNVTIFSQKSQISGVRAHSMSTLGWHVSCSWYIQMIQVIILITGRQLLLKWC